MKLFWLADLHKDQMHGIFAGEVTNFGVDMKPKAFMAELRRTLGDVGDQLHKAVAIRVREEAVAEKEQALEVAETKRKERKKTLEAEDIASA